MQISKIQLIEDMVGSYVMFLDETDSEKLVGIMKKVFMDNQYEQPEIIRMRLKETMFESMMQHIENSRPLKKSSRKKPPITLDYQFFAKNCLKEAKRMWVKEFSEKRLSPENMRHFRKLFRKIIKLQGLRGNEQRLYQRCLSFIGELRRASERASRKKILPKQPSGFHTSIMRRRGNQPIGIDLVAKIMEMEPTFEKCFLKSLSRPERENLLLALENIDHATRDSFIRFPKLKKLIANNSEFMDAVRFRDRDAIFSMLGIRKYSEEPGQENRSVSWKEYVFPKNTKIRFISGATRNTTHVSKALKEINVTPIFLHTSKLRMLEEAIRGNDMLVLVTGFINHKIQQKLNALGRDYVAISYICSSNICQRLIEACLKKGIPLAKKN